MLSKFYNFQPNIESDFIPHEEFHQGYWLLPKNCKWYYFLRTKRSYEIPKDKNFYQSVDKELKPIVNLLHSNNIPTTPSCAGHFQTKDNYNKLYDEIIQTQNQIKTKGVEFVCSESGEKYYFKDDLYKFPYDREYFLDRINIYQRKGVIGFLDIDKTFYNNLQHLDIIQDNGITLILTESNSENECSDIWHNIYLDLVKIVQ